MLWTTIFASALVAATGASASSDISPLFFFSSTKSLQTSPLPENPPVSDVHHTLWGALSTCPTKHYAVVVQPGVTTSDYADTDTWLPIGAGVRTAVITENVQGNINVNAVINTILMDCLHHGVLHVKQLNTEGLKLEDLSREVVRENVIYAVLPDLSAVNGWEREKAREKHDEYVEGIVGKYYGNREYTLIYVTEGRDGHEEDVEASETLWEEHGVGAEAPLLFVEEDD